jgi:hypothetical protein
VTDIIVGLASSIIPIRTVQATDVLFVPLFALLFPWLATIAHVIEPVGRGQNSVSAAKPKDLRKFCERF